MNQSWIFWLSYLIGIENKAAVMLIDYFASSAKKRVNYFSTTLLCYLPMYWAEVTSRLAQTRIITVA
jgi:hypothetical protein